MHLEVLSPAQTKLIPLISGFHPQFGLVGGTAIALHFGHRRSIDFDLFTPKNFSTQNIKNHILQSSKIDHTFIQGQNELTILVQKVKLTFYLFPYSIKYSQPAVGDLKMPDLITLGAMKIFALGKRAKWKDYVDLYFLLNSFSLDQLTQKAHQIFGNEFNEKLCRVQLGYFQDIDFSEQVDFLPNFQLSPQKVQTYLLQTSLN